MRERVIQGRVIRREAYFMEKKGWIAGLKMNVFMGATLSFFLSLQGNFLGYLESGNFSVPSWLISFLLGFIISFVVCLVVPMRKLTDYVIAKSKRDPRTIACRCLVTLVSDCLFTPLMTFVMVYIAYKGAVKHGAQMPFAPMFFKSFIFSMITAFILIFFLQPIFLRWCCPWEVPGTPQYKEKHGVK